jgi:hypothetical protein
MKNRKALDQVCNRSCIIICGSEGYVGSTLRNYLNVDKLISIDKINGQCVSLHIDIAELEIDRMWNDFDIDTYDSVYVIYLAALRIDDEENKLHYKEKNIDTAKAFFSKLAKKKITKVIHISSVAAIIKGFDYIPSAEFDWELLSSDDAYRNSKKLQDEVVQRHIIQAGIPLDILYPSVIYDDFSPTDTNIHRIRNALRYLPFLPKLKIYKSTTPLDYLCMVIVDRLKITSSNHILCVSTPTPQLDVFLKRGLGIKKITISVPFMKFLLLGIAKLISLLGVKSKLTTSRIKKLFIDTDESTLDLEGIIIAKIDEMGIRYDCSSTE